MMTPREIDDIAERVAEIVLARMNSRPSEGFVDKYRAAAILGISVPTLERRAADETIPSHKIGRLRRYLPSELLGNKKGGAA
jgi:excisionase family DNA binding protein